MSGAFGRNVDMAFTAGTRIESDEVKGVSVDSFVLQAFQKLYETEDVEKAINGILEIVGRKYNVSRVYIYEDAKDGMHTRNTFEWCNQGIPSQMYRLQNVNYKKMGGKYRENFDENGIFYCQDIAALPQEHRPCSADRMSAPCFSVRCAMEVGSSVLWALMTARYCAGGHRTKSMR